MDGNEQSTADQRSGTTAPPSAAWDPVRYLRFAGERARAFAELAARVAAEAPETAVDLGCGEGALTASLARRWPGARVTGVDSSATKLAAAVTHAVPGRVEFTVGDVRDWQPPGPVDVVVSNALLHWVSQPRPVLAHLDETDAAAYAVALREARPPRPDGTTLLPFQRVFASSGPRAGRTR